MAERAPRNSRGNEAPHLRERSRAALESPGGHCTTHARSIPADARPTHLPSFDGLECELADTDIFMGLSLKGRPSFRSRPNFMELQAVSAGIAQFMYPELRERGVILTNAGQRALRADRAAYPGNDCRLGPEISGLPALPRERIWALNELWTAPVKPRELRGQVLLFHRVWRDRAEQRGSCGP